MYNYWIQRHDYSIEQFENVDLREAIKEFVTFNWHKELSAFDESDSRRNCAPGIGINNGFQEDDPDGAMLHICPSTDGVVDFYLHYRVPKKLLGLIPQYKEQTHQVRDYDRSKVPELIQLFFEGRKDDILQIAA